MSKPIIKLGPIIEGTMRPMDTIPAMINECFRRGIGYAEVINATSEQWPDEELQMGRALRVLTNGILGDRAAVVAIPDHAWWTKDLDNGQGWTNHDENNQVWQELVDLLNEDLAGATFGTHPDDPACLGYWAEPNEDTRGEGVTYEWERKFPGLVIRTKESNDPDEVFLQDESMQKFMAEIGAVDFIWMNDPENTEERAFKTIEEHYDAIMDPYLGTT